MKTYILLTYICIIFIYSIRRSTSIKNIYINPDENKILENIRYSKGKMAEGSTHLSGLRFYCASPEEIRSASVCEVTCTDTYNASSPVRGGLFDLRMGTIEPAHRCETCGQGPKLCTGHFGHIDLALPLFWPHLKEYVIKVLRCVCLECSRLLIDVEEPEVQAILHRTHGHPTGQVRLDDILDLIKRRQSLTRVCRSSTDDSRAPVMRRGCGAVRPVRILRHDKSTSVASVESYAMLTAEFLDRPPVHLTAGDVRRVLQRVTDEACGVMGFRTRPENMICSVLPVPPPAMRPSVKMDRTRREDDATHAIGHIAKGNERVKELMSDGESTGLAMAALQAHLNAYINDSGGSSAGGQAQFRTGRAIHSIFGRWGGKEQRIRGTMTGKRVEFSARSVISPDPEIEVGELGVPYATAMTLTVPRRVTEANRAELTEMVRNGADVYPGANFVQKKSGAYVNLRVRRDADFADALEVGDVVDRHLMNGDSVLFNRQPSLHRMSAMAHRVRVVEYDSFRLNPSVTPAYNADFDGDEMNTHVPQSLVAMVEIATLASVESQIVSPRHGHPIVSLVQDAALGSSIMSRDGEFVTHRVACDLMAVLGDDGSAAATRLPPAADGPVAGRALLNLTLPAISTDIPVGNDVVRVRDGALLPGPPLTKDVYQKPTVGIIHSTVNAFGTSKAAEVFYKTQRLACEFLRVRGFSVSMGDLSVSAETQENVEGALTEVKSKIDELFSAAHRGEYVNNSVRSDGEAFEHEIISILNSAPSKVSFDKESNNILDMVNAKSKGNKANVRQLSAFLGQQNVAGKRPTDGLSHRALPCFLRFMRGAEEGGFITRNFREGLRPQEFVVHAEAGRVGMIDTANRTAEIGYVQRKIVKANENARVVNDMTVRGPGDRVVQFEYGGDSANPVCVQEQPPPPSALCSSIKELKKLYLSPKASERERALFEQIKQDRDQYVRGTFASNPDERALRFPVNFSGALSGVGNGTGALAGANDVLDELDRVAAAARAWSPGGRGSAGADMFAALCRAHLSPKQVSGARGTREGLRAVADRLLTEYKRSTVHPNTMVGVIAGQSIGEPATQLLLNSFHSSGDVMAGGVAGIPRLKELLSATPHIKGASMVVRLLKSALGDATHDDMRRLSGSIQMTTLGDLVDTAQVLYDVSDERTTAGNDAAALRTYAGAPPGDENRAALDSPWLLRFEVSRDKLHASGAGSMLVVGMALTVRFSGACAVRWTDDGADELVIRVRVALEDEDPVTTLRALQKLMLSTKIKGVDRILRVAPTERETSELDDVSDVTVVRRRKQVVLATQGSNLSTVLGLPFVDQRYTTTNDVVEILRVLGVEAARAALVSQLRQVIEEAVDDRHFGVIADGMTARGGLQSLDRRGINSVYSGNSVLQKASFEETTDVITKACVFSAYDDLSGVTASVMTGKVPPSGTTDTALLIDTDYLGALAAAAPPHPPAHGGTDAEDAPGTPGPGGQLTLAPLEDLIPVLPVAPAAPRDFGAARAAVASTGQVMVTWAH